MKGKMERMEVVYDQKNDKIAIALQSASAGFVLKPSTENAVHAVAAWASVEYIYEPWIWRTVSHLWRLLKHKVFRRPICTGRYERAISYHYGKLVIRATYYGKPGDNIPFLAKGKHA